MVISAALALTAWVAAVGAIGVWRHDQLLSHRYDLGNMTQAVWSTAHGRVLEMTDGTTGEQIVFEEEGVRVYRKAVATTED